MLVHENFGGPPVCVRNRLQGRTQARAAQQQHTPAGKPSETRETGGTDEMEGIS